MSTMLKAAARTIIVVFLPVAALAQTLSLPVGTVAGATAPTVPLIVTPAPARGDRAESSAGQSVQAESPVEKRQRIGDTSQPPAPRQPNEFQRFVYSTTGQALPVFGTAYFTGSGSPHNYAPVERLPVPADYTLGPGDELQLRGWGTVDIDLRAVVDRNGQINIPRVGTVGVAGIRAGEIEAPTAVLQGLLGQRNVRLVTKSGLTLELRLSAKKLGPTARVAHVDVSGDLPTDAAAWRSVGDE
jgi:hypothetical protein